MPDEDQAPPPLSELEEELKDVETLELEEHEEIPEEDFPAPEYVGQVTIGNKACIGGTAYVDVWIEIRPGSTTHVYLAVAFFNSAGAGIGSTGWLGPYRPSSASQRYIGRRLRLGLPRRSAYVQGWGRLGASPTQYRSARLPFVCG